MANSEGALDAARAHAILVSGEHLRLERLTVARAFRCQGERALAIQAPRPLRPALRVAVFLQAFAAAMRADMHHRR